MCSSNRPCHSPRTPSSSFFFFNDPATTEIYTLSLHDALPISDFRPPICGCRHLARSSTASMRSEEHTSELQSRRDLVCRLLLEKKKNIHRLMCDLLQYQMRYLVQHSVRMK